MVGAEGFGEAPAAGATVAVLIGGIVAGPEPDAPAGGSAEGSPEDAGEASGPDQPSRTSRPVAGRQAGTRPGSPNPGSGGVEAFGPEALGPEPSGTTVPDQ